MPSAPLPAPHKLLALLAMLSYRSDDLSTYLEQIACSVNRLLGQDWSVVTLCNGQQERILASSLELGAAADEIYTLHGTLTGRAVSQGCHLVVEDVVANPHYGAAPEGYRAYLGVPLRSPAGAILGTICSL